MTFPTILGVLLPASTSAKIRMVRGGSAKGATRAEVDAAVQSGLKSGESVLRSRDDVGCSSQVNLISINHDKS
jgi:hypothetical protein